MARKGTSAGTAAGPMYIAACEQFLPAAERIVDDPLAPDLLDGSALVLYKLSRWAWLRRIMFRQTERKGPGVWGGVLCRKRFIAETVSQAIADGIEALVVLGAGYDSLASRITRSTGLPVFELDQAENIAAKRVMLERVFGALPDGLHLVPIDFETTDTGTTLAANGHDPTMETLFVLEGITQYLTAEAIKRTFDGLSYAAAGSGLVFTYVSDDFIAGKNMHDAAVIYRQYVKGYQLWRFGLAPEKLAAFLKSYGWRLVEDVGAKDWRERYAVPANRDLPIMDIERVAFAVKDA